MIDLNTEFGKRVLRRLQAAPTIWLTTVSRDGTPQPRPVCFLWTGEAFLIFSRPEGAKLRHISRNPRSRSTWTAMVREATSSSSWGKPPSNCKGPRPRR